MGELKQGRTECLKYVAGLVDRVYEFSLVGGNAHIVLDDGNVEEEHIHWCLDVALPENVHEASPEQLKVERECLQALLELSEDDRRLVLGIGEDGGRY